MERYKQEELFQKNEKIYGILKGAEPTYTLKEWGTHTDQIEKIRSSINMIERRRHQ